MSDRERSFEQLYRLHAPAVQRRAAELLGSAVDAREIVQDVFTSLWERPEQYGGKSALTTFLYGTTTHACLNRLRNQRTRKRLLVEHTADASAAQPARAEHLAQLRQLLEQLPDELAQVAVYYYLDEMTYDEIAETMGRSRRHVANLLRRLLEWHGSRTEPA